MASPPPPPTSTTCADIDVQHDFAVGNQYLDGSDWQIRHYDHGLSQRKVGGGQFHNFIQNFYFKLWGQADYWRITNYHLNHHSDPVEDAFRIDTETVAAGTFWDSASSTYQIPIDTLTTLFVFPDYQDENIYDTPRFYVEALDSSSTPKGDLCRMRFSLSSPVVFTFQQEGLPTLSSFSQKRVLFDLDHNGTKEHTGWLGAGEAFWVLDLNGNGQIDSG